MPGNRRARSDCLVECPAALQGPPGTSPRRLTDVTPRCLDRLACVPPDPLSLSAVVVVLLPLCAAVRADQRLQEIRSWAFQLQNVDPVEIKLSPYDLIVIDYGFDRRNATAFPREVVNLMRSKPDGKKRLLFAYLSVGEAESYRYYWQDNWLTARPEWLGPGKPDSPGHHLLP